MEKYVSEGSAALRNLDGIFKDNFKITRLYSAYLESCPEVITRDIIGELEAAGVEKGDAIAALLCSLFSLDTEHSADDRRLLGNYIRPSIRILDAEKYRQDPYYKNIPLSPACDGDWQIKYESYAPYRAVICADMEIGEDYSEIPPLGFFTEEFRFPAVLEGGNEWMTLTPVDMDTCTEAIDQASGKVLTYGLGLGYYAYMVSEKPQVESITVVERSEAVIRLFNKYVLPHFSHPEKLRIINADAFEYAREVMPNEGYSLVFVDTWRDASDGSEHYLKMKPNEAKCQGTKFIYWIESFIISRLRAVRFEQIRALIAGGAKFSLDKIKKLLSKEELVRPLGSEWEDQR